MATIDKERVCLISDVNTDNYRMHVKVGNSMIKGNFGY